MEEGNDAGTENAHTRVPPGEDEDVVTIARVVDRPIRRERGPAPPPSFMDTVTQDEVGMAGLILVILSIIGLIICFGIAWLTLEEEDGDTETWKYGDFGDDFKDGAGSDMDSYFHGNARNAVLGFIALLLVGLLLIWQALTGKLYHIIEEHLPSALRSNPDHPEFLKVFLTMILMVISLVIVISGSRFIGFAHSYNSSEFDGFEIDTGTPAGLGVFILGLVLLGLEIRYLYDTLGSKIVEDTVAYRKGARKCLVLMGLVSMVGLITFSLLPFIEYSSSVDYQGFTADTTIDMNDGLIQIMSDAIFTGDFDSLNSDLSWMRISLWGGFFISALTFLGLLYLQYTDDDMTGRFHQILTFGALVLIMAVIFMIFHLLFFTHIGDLENDVDNQMGMAITEGSFASNIIPLICGIALLGLAVLYVKETYPISISRVLGALPIQSTAQNEDDEPAGKKEVGIVVDEDADIDEVEDDFEDFKRPEGEE